MNISDIIWPIVVLAAVALAYSAGYARGRLDATKFFKDSPR